MGEPARHTGSPRRSGRDPRRAARLGRLALSGALALLGAAATTAPALAGPLGRPAFATVSTEFPVSVSITGLTNANGTLTATGQVTNGGSGTIAHPHAGIKLGGKQNTRSNIANVMSRSDPTDADGTELKSPQQQLGELPAGGTAKFELKVAESDLKLDHNGVYELSVDVEDDSENVLGIARTLLPSFPDSKGTSPTLVGTVWPLTHAPELVAQTTEDLTPVLRDDTLAKELAPDGRLGRLVTIGKTVQSLTWAIDPDLLDTVFAMTKPYRVQLPGHEGETARADNTKAGTGRDVATAWLAALQQAVTQNNDEVIALPYADPDLASLAHNGSGLAGVDTALGRARAAGTLTVEGRLSVDVKDNFAWPYQGYLDQPTAAVAQKLGASVLLVNGAAMPERTSLPFTPSAARQIANGQTAVVADSTVSGLFQSDLNTQQLQTQATQRFLAETLAITLQQPNVQRTLLVLPPRDMTADTAQTLAASIKSARDDGKWISTTTVSSIAAYPADPKAATAVPSASSYPENLKSSELTAGELGDVSGMQQGVDRLLRILTNAQRVNGPFNAAMDRSMSTAWRSQQQAGQKFRGNAQSYLNQLSNAVAIQPKSQITTMPGNSGLLQVSVKNGLTQTVTNLQLRLTSKQPNRLRVVNEAVTVQLDPGHSATLVFGAQAAATGTTQMTAQLLTMGPDSAPYGPEMTFKVQVTNVPSGVWWVVGAGGVLVLLAGVRIYLKRKTRTGEDEDPDAPLAQPEGTDEADGGATQP